MKKLLILLALLWAVPAQAQLTVTERLTEASTANATSYTSTGTFSVTTSKIGICYVANTDADSPETLTGLTQTGQTWTEIGTVTYNSIATPLNRVTAYRTLGAGAAAATVTAAVTGGTDNQTGMIFNCFEVAGTVDVSGGEAAAIVQFKTSQQVGSTTAHTTTLDAGRSTGSALIHFVGIDGTAAWTAEYGATGTETAQATPSSEGRAQWDIGGADSTPTWTTNVGTASGGFAIEVKAEGGAPPAVPKNLLLLGAGGCQ